MIIAFEGLDQSGKATQARRLRAHVERQRQVAHHVSFPDYDTSIGREIASGLSGDREHSAEVMQLLYVANRFEYKSRLEQWLAAGDIVVCDRYCASSVAYGEAQGLDVGWLGDIQRGLPPAAVTLLLDIAPETAVRRKAAGRDRYERDLSLLARVRESYRRQARGAGWTLIDAEQSPDAVAEAVLRALPPSLAPPSARERS